MVVDDGDFTTGLTPAATERLALLIEGCSGVVQAASKALRNGYGPNNREALAKEIGQLEAAILILKFANDILASSTDKAFTQKINSVKASLHFNKGLVP